MLKKYSFDLNKNNSIQYLVGFLILFVYAGSLFFPLIDKDAAHHANIALYMYEHNDYVSLIDRGKDYLDKPHFLFWTSLLSFKIFGVNTFAYRFPAFLFTLVSVYSVYKLTRHLWDKTTAKIAAVIMATALGMILSINDARMETPLTAGISFALWQLIVYIDKRAFMNLLFAALGTAVAFSTKGWLGPVIIFIPAFFYILLNRKWAVLSSIKTWTFIPLFFLFISPVLYAYYLQYDLHPEKIIRGEGNRSGVKFILWDQLFERYSGFDEGGRNSDYFFLYHTFLWAFFPWSLVAYTAVFFWLRRMFHQKKWRNTAAFAALSFALLLVVISFSKFKMPHYIIMFLPLATLITAAYVRLVLTQKNIAKIFLKMQEVFSVLVLLLTIVLNYYFFWPRNILVWIIGSLALIVFVWLLLKRNSNKAAKFLYISASMSIMLGFFLNYNFFPSLMKYQGGNELAAIMKKKKIEIADSSIISLEFHAHSFDFYRNYNHRLLDSDSLIKYYPAVKDNYFLLTANIQTYLQKKGFTIEPIVAAKDYSVARLSLKFLNPKTRAAQMDTLMIAKIIKR
jgi:4-amino-4-deoxy-L-arabinose transferase-like glycosyltransferase